MSALLASGLSVTSTASLFASLAAAALLLGYTVLIERRALREAPPATPVRR
jgi:hypothetical protein